MSVVVLLVSAIVGLPGLSRLSAIVAVLDVTLCNKFGIGGWEIDVDDGMSGGRGCGRCDGNCRRCSK